MFKAVGRGVSASGKTNTVYMLGLEAVNLFRLAKGQPINVPLSDLVEGCEDVIVIFAGETAADCALQLKTASLGVPVHQGPKPQ